MSEETIKILGREVQVRHEEVSISELKYFEENPRVYSSIHGKRPTDEGELQEWIHKKMLEQPSVKKLIPEIQTHGGLLEPIVVRYDTKQVIEGNSRLAAFRFLWEKTKEAKWAKIPCSWVVNLTGEEQDAYLSQVHVKGKTPWSAYEKANFYYTRHRQGISVDEIAKRFSVTPTEVKKTVEIVSLMDGNNDKDQSHFSYYEVLIRTRRITKSNGYTDEVKKMLLEEIKSDKPGFTAQELRDKMPSILKKKKELKKFLERQSTLDEAFQNARQSGPKIKIKTAKDKIEDISEREVSSLKIQEINALLADVKMLSREINRVQKMIEKTKEEKQNNAS